MNKNPLENFPSVYYISLEESVERREALEKQFSEYNIIPKPIISKRFSQSNDIITGECVHLLNSGTAGSAASHLRMIRQWYEETNDEYGFFCEDDLSLETISYWNFTWKDFIDQIPPDAHVIQLHVIRKEFKTFNLHRRLWDNWSAAAYILTREYAKILIDRYCLSENEFHLEIKKNGDHISPLCENILFETMSDVSYSIPLFVENLKMKSTFSIEEDSEIINGQKNGHCEAVEIVLNYWKRQSKSLMSDIESLLVDYSQDPENAESNFNLGIWYWNHDHTAPASSFFLRCAERAEDALLAYESLLFAHLCYEKQGTRDWTAKTFLHHAMCLLPSRPEAYYLIAKFYNKREQWQDTYVTIEQAFHLIKENSDSLRENIGYSGEYALFYEKSIAAWWWGKSNESKKILRSLNNNYDLSIEYKHLINESLNKYNNKNLKFSNDFDWGDLSYEDIITIEREILDENVYSFWKSVNKNDIVMDIGSSVGPFVYSILDKKPKKVYCIEPSLNLIKTLSKNCTEKILNFKDNPLVLINKAIISVQNDNVNIFGDNLIFETSTFKNIIDEYQIDKINFLKIDCEGGEYSVFTEENIEFLIQNVDFIAMEVHLNYKNCREKFKNFRDNYLTKFNNYKVMSCTRQNMSWGVSLDIKEKIFDDDFVDNYSCEFMIYILNR